jgi:hypothetical protein
MRQSKCGSIVHISKVNKLQNNCSLSVTFESCIMKLFHSLLLFSVIISVIYGDASLAIKHPFIHLGDYEATNESMVKYFYSGDIHASWQKAVELCEIFEMQLTIFKDAEEDEYFRENFSSFFDGRDAFIFIAANTTAPGRNWKWMNGEKINFDISWGEKQPNNEGNKEFCLCFDESNPLLYHDISCNEKYPFVCQEEWTFERVPVKKMKN